jgi:transposase
VRDTTLLSRILGIKYTRVLDAHFERNGLLVDVAPSTRQPRCSGCGRIVSAVYDGRERRWRHLDVAGMVASLRYRQRRVDCPRCGVLVEMVPWAETGSWFTRDFEQTVTYLAQHAAKSVVVAEHAP